MTSPTLPMPATLHWHLTCFLPLVKPRKIQSLCAAEGISDCQLHNLLVNLTGRRRVRIVWSHAGWPGDTVQCYRHHPWEACSKFQFEQGELCVQIPLPGCDPGRPRKILRKFFKSELYCRETILVLFRLPQSQNNYCEISCTAKLG